MNNPLTELYRSILQSMGIVADNEGYLSMVYNEKKFPWMITDESGQNKTARRMVLTTPFILKNPDWNSMVAFHPLSEDIMMGMSPVIRKLLEVVNLTLNIRINAFMAELIELATDPRKSKKISPKCADFMVAASEAGDSTPGAYKNMVRNIGMDKGSKRVIAVSVKRGSTLHGKNYSRVGVVKFPIVKDFDDKHTTNSAGKEVADYSIFGAKMTKKDRNAIRNIFTWVFPDSVIRPEEYCVGTNSMVAPYFDVLVRTYATVCRRINDVVGMFGKALPNAESHLTDLSWLPEIDNLSKFNGMLPTPLEFNIGVPVKGDHREHHNVAVEQPVQTTAASVVPDSGEGAPLAIGMSAQMMPQTQYIAPVIQPMFEAVVETPAPQPVYQQPMPQQMAQPQSADPAFQVVNAFANLAAARQQPMMMPMQQMPMQHPMMMPMQQMPTQQPMMMPMQQMPTQQPMPLPVQQPMQQMPIQQPMMMPMQQMPMQQPMMMPMQQMPMQQPMMTGGYGGGRQYLPPAMAMAAPGSVPQWPVR